VPIDEELDARTVTKVAEEGVEALILRGVGGLLAPVGLRTRVGGSTARVRVPAKLPVAVDVATQAGLVRGTIGSRVTALAPQTVGYLGVDEAVGVDEWDDVKVVLVQNCLDEFVFSVAIDDLKSDVLQNLERKRQYYGRNPLAWG
jgi:hypothetical protein